MKRHQKAICSWVPILIIVCMMLYYNHKRIMGYYIFGFQDKIITFNFIPFYKFGFLVSEFYDRIILKIIFFAVIGVLLHFILYLNSKCTKLYYFICIFIVAAVLEFFVSFTTGLLNVPIDINNWMFYFTGAAFGIVLWRFIIYICKKLVNLCKRVAANW